MSIEDPIVTAAEVLGSDLTHLLTSPDVENHNGGPANIVDVVAGVASNLRKVADSITPQDASRGHTQNGGSVGSLTEAVMDASVSLGRIADAIHSLADAVRDRA